jgi:hypothetical protein
VPLTIKIEYISVSSKVTSFAGISSKDIKGGEGEGEGTFRRNGTKLKDRTKENNFLASMTHKNRTAKMTSIV